MAAGGTVKAVKATFTCKCQQISALRHVCILQLYFEILAISMSPTAGKRSFILQMRKANNKSLEIAIEKLTALLNLFKLLWKSVKHRLFLLLPDFLF